MGTPETRLRQRFLNNLGLHACCTEIILHCASVSNQLQQWTNFGTNFSPKKVGEWGTRLPCRKKWGDAVPPRPHPTALVMHAMSDAVTPVACCVGAAAAHPGVVVAQRRRQRRGDLYLGAQDEHHGSELPRARRRHAPRQPHQAAPLQGCTSALQLNMPLLQVHIYRPVNNALKQTVRCV